MMMVYYDNNIRRAAAQKCTTTMDDNGGGLLLELNSTGLPPLPRASLANPFRFAAQDFTDICTEKWKSHFYTRQSARRSAINATLMTISRV